jgi:signal transduction histidine kinase
MNDKRRIIRITTWIAAVAAVAVALSLPLGYFAISYQYMLGSLETEAEINSRIVADLIKDNPDLWRYEQLRLTELLALRPRAGRIEALRILDLQNQLIAENADPLSPPLIMRSCELKDAGVTVGRIEITRSLEPLLVHTGLVALFGLSIGLVVFITLRVLPIRAVIQAEESLLQSREELVRKNQELNALNIAMEQRTRVLEITNEELQQFSFIASHDLQEPLRKIQTFGGRLRAKYVKVLDEQGLDYLDRMQKAAGRMQSLLSELLTYSRITTRAQPFATVDLTKLAQGVVSDLEAVLERTGGRVEVVVELSAIDADPLQIRQLLRNLIGNALKFCRPEEPPLVKVRCCRIEAREERQTGGLCQIVVADNGIGFDEKYLDRIFAPFQQLHGRSEYEGTGMGLAICRKIATRHGGSITAESSPGKGAAFFVTLPVTHIDAEGGCHGEA